MNKKIQSFIAVIMAIVILPCIELAGLVDIAPFAEIEASASSYFTNGYCGEITESNDGTNISWTLYDDGTLNITGSGRMAPDAFTYDLRIKSVVISDGITNVSSSCFYECNNLVTVTLGNDIETIDEKAFYFCSAIKNINLPDSLTQISDIAFGSCTSIADITLPENLTSIGAYAFNSCAGLTSITIPDNVTYVGKLAFSSCTALRKAYIGAGVSDFDSDTFFSCENLEEINVSENNNSYASLKGILYNKEITKLIAVPANIKIPLTIPATVEEFSHDAIAECTKISTIRVEAGSLHYKSIDGIVYTADGKTLIACPRDRYKDVTVADGTETIGDSAFSYCRSVKNITLPESVINIEKQAFSNCRFNEITLPSNLKNIGIFAFAECTSLRSISLPDNLEKVERLAFSGCISLVQVNLGSAKISVEPSIFQNCSSLVNVSVSENNPLYTSLNGLLFNKEATKLYFVPKGISGEITLPATLEEFDYTFVDDCKEITNINVEEGNLYYKSVDGLVYTADGKKLIVCPRKKQITATVIDGTEVIGVSAFSRCRSLYYINLPESLTEVEDYAFNNCDSLSTLELPESITKIGQYAFAQSERLGFINIPKSITTITNFIFYGVNFSSLTLPEHVQSFDHTGWNQLRVLTIENRNCEYTSVDEPIFDKNCKIRAYCGSPGHSLAIKRLLKFESIGHTYLDWYVDQPATFDNEGIEHRDCAYCDGYEERTIPKLRSDTYTATFVANGEIIASVDFAKDATEIEEPAVPAKDRYIGEWEKYTLSNNDITINAVYTLIKSSDASEIEADSSVTHYIAKDDLLFKLSASADATVVKSTISNSVPLDIVLVVDQSGSMDETLGGKTKKVDALKATALEFVNSVYENAKMTGCDHRISLVGFGLSGNYDGYEKNENTELLTSENGIVNYTKITPDDYAGSLVSANINGKLNDKLSAAIDSIDARGATAADLGFEMAKGIFANTDSTGRQRVVIFMTDGEPTYLSGFQISVANAAIANAYTLKSVYDTSIYSVGVFTTQQSNNTNIRKFMNAVSSGYPNARSMSNMGKGNDGEFFTNVNNTDALSSVFGTISTEALSHTAPFNNLTLVKTLSECVTLTARQEQTLRTDLIRKYGITNDDIIVTRKDDGTTVIKIHSLVPEKIIDYKGNVKYVIDVEFFASLNENAATAGNFIVDTEDSGIMLSPDAKGYEITFNTSSISLSESKIRVIFTVNGEFYEISESIDPNGYAHPPAIEISEGWTFFSWPVLFERARNGLVLNSTLIKPIRTIIWHTDSADIMQTYTVGDFITPPVDDYTAEGYSFLSWDRSIPTTMPDEDLEFTAVYGEHVHNYTSYVTTEVTCETDGIRTYVCLCGDTYTKTVPALGHNYEAITPSIEKEDSKCTFVCVNCGDKYEYALDYQIVKASGKRTQVLYEFSLTDKNLDTNIQPDGEIYIRIPLAEIHGNTKNVTVIRTNDDGTTTKVPAVIENEFLIITCDHFTPYEVRFEINCINHIDTDGDNLCDTCETVLEEESETKPEDQQPPQEAICDHICHKDGFLGFIWDIINFFQKLFQISPMCECGVAHY